MKTLSIILIVIMALCLLLFIIIAIVSQFCFDDKDPDLNWHDEYTVIKCPHLNTTDVVVSSAVNCEEVHTICDDCSKVLKRRTDCE